MKKKSEFIDVLYITKYVVSEEIIRYVSWLNDFLNILLKVQYYQILDKGNNKITEQSYKGKVKTHNYINRQNQSTTGKLWKP